MQQGPLANVRQAFDYIIFAVLERHLLRITHNVHVDLFERLFSAYGDISVISLNYDIIADNSLITLSEMVGKQAVEDVVPIRRELRSLCQRCHMIP